MKKKNKYINRLLAVVLYCLLHGSLIAQSYTEINSTMTIFPGQGATEVSQALYIGPNANINVMGEWRIASQQVFISPLATITGPGTMIFDKPSTYKIGTVPLAWTTQTVDGGGVTIGCHVLLRNDAGVTLDSIHLPPVLTLAPDTVADVAFSQELAFADTASDGSALTGDNLILNDSRSVFTQSGIITNYTPDHFIVTNGIGTVAKQSLGAQSFIFPIGIAKGDYTPASIVNNGTSDEYDVRVMEGINPAYQVSASVDRTWAVTEAVPGGSNVILTLQHNYATGYGGPGTSGSDYDNADSYISGSLPNTPTWDKFTSMTGTAPGPLTSGAPIANASILMRSDLTDFSATTRYTKLSPIYFTSLQLIKTAIPDSIFLSDTFSYHICVVNMGPLSQIRPVTVHDTLPSGALYLTSAGSGWTTSYANGVVTATHIDSISIGDSATFNIVVQGLTNSLNNLAYVNGGSSITVPSAPCDTCTPGTPTAPTVRHPVLLIPDAFSPNGDGVNDEFVITDVLHIYPKATVSIYNRWGDEVWNSNGPYRNNFAGNGSDGSALPVGTYYYAIEFNDGTGRKESHFLDLSR